MKTIRSRIIPVLAGMLILAVTAAVAGRQYAGAASWPDPAYVTLSGSVALKGDKKTGDIKAGQFQFKVTSESDELQLPDRTFDVGAGGKVSLGSFTFTEEGIYVFRIQQIKGDEKGYSYDTAIVTASVTVKKNAGTNRMEGTVSYKKAGSAISGITFSNTYTEERVEVPAGDTPVSESVAEPVEKLESDVKVSDETVKPGEETTLSLRFTNSGDAALYGLYVRLYVPQYMLFTACEDSGGYGAIDGKEHSTWFVEELKPGESVELWMNCRLNICLPDDAEIKMEAYAEITGGTEPILVNDPNDPAEQMDGIDIITAE